MVNSLVKDGVPINKLAITFSGVSENEIDYAAAKDYVGQTSYFVIDGYTLRKPAPGKAQDTELLNVRMLRLARRPMTWSTGIPGRIDALTGEPNCSAEKQTG